MSGEPRDLAHELDRDRRTARRGYAASLMSNSKWRTVFGVLHELGVQQITIKFVDADDAKAIRVPDLRTPRPFVGSEFGPISLVGIEWVEISSVDINAVREALESTGKQLPLESTTTGLRVIGHASATGL